jgi:hypothetical protein
MLRWIFGTAGMIAVGIIVWRLLPWQDDDDSDDGASTEDRDTRDGTE